MEGSTAYAHKCSSDPIVCAAQVHSDEKGDRREPERVRKDRKGVSATNSFSDDTC